MDYPKCGSCGDSVVETEQHIWYDGKDWHNACFKNLKVKP